MGRRDDRDPHAIPLFDRLVQVETWYKVFCSYSRNVGLLFLQQKC